MYYQPNLIVKVLLRNFSPSRKPIIVWQQLQCNTELAKQHSERDEGKDKFQMLK